MRSHAAPRRAKPHLLAGKKVRFLFYFLSLPNGHFAVYVMPVVTFFRRLRFAVIIPRRVRQERIAVRIGDCRPLACRTFVIDARQAAATIERRITDRSHAVGNNYARQTTATIERILTDRSHAAGNFYAHQAIARRERPITDRSHTVGNFHARQTTATTERLITDRSHAVGNRERSRRFSACILNQCFSIFGIQISINRLIVSIICTYFNVRQATAPIERRITDRSHAVGDYHARQATARRERIPTDRSHVAPDHHARQATAIRERRITDRIARSNHNSL